MIDIQIDFSTGDVVFMYRDRTVIRQKWHGTLRKLRDMVRT